MTIQMRAFHWNKDFEKVRKFLIDTHRLTGTFQNWIPSMFENRKFGPGGPLYTDEDDEFVKIWEDPNISSESKMIAVTIRKPSGTCWIQIHPDYREVEKYVIKTLEVLIQETKKNQDGETKIQFLVAESDRIRQEHLSELGYEKLGVEEHNRIRPVDKPVPDYTLPEGFSIRHVDIMEEYEKYRDLQGSVFKHMGNMKKEQAKLYSEASFYNTELDLVAVDPDGKFASFVTVRIDPVSKMAELEPVGTHPDYRGMGLAKATILEALGRVAKYNPTCMVILGAAPTEGATKLYDSLGFSKENVHLWQKEL
jgi:ribosomal protein S18 acetylase RimI-like enzyme